MNGYRFGGFLCFGCESAASCIILRAVTPRQARGHHARSDLLPAPFFMTAAAIAPATTGKTATVKYMTV